METNPYAASVNFSQTEIGNVISALGDGFKYILPIGLTLIALVMGAMWLLGKAKRFASASK